MEAMNKMKTNYIVSTDQDKLNIELIHNFLSKESYWAQGRSIEKVKKSIENSLSFGVYLDNEQVGFARVVTDFAIFGWIMDVFILDEYRGKGLGKMLMDAIVNHEDLQGLQRWGLATNDAHGLYEKYGFKKLDRPELFMEISTKLND